MKLLTVAIFIIGFICIDSVNADLLVNGYDADKHDRFNNSNEFIGNPHDWSGVGKRIDGTGGRWGTMVSDSFFLAVDHASPAVNANLRFFHTNDSTGAFEDRTVAQTWKIAGVDLKLGRLSTSVSSNVQKFSVLDVSKSVAADLDLMVFGLAGSSHPAATRVRLGTNRVDEVHAPGTFTGINYDLMLYDYDVAEGQGEAKVRGGDSGAPSFVLAPTGPALIGLHTIQYSDFPTAGESGSGDVFLPSYIEDINAVMSGFGEQLSLVSVPEPNSVAILMVGLFAISTVRRKRVTRKS